MITSEQVADLQPGDIVEYAGHPELKGAKVIGPLHLRNGDGTLYVADYVVRDTGGEPGRYAREQLTLTVVSRAPRPMYVNHPRTKPVPGDVVRLTDCVGDSYTNVYLPRNEQDDEPWLSIHHDPGARYSDEDALVGHLDGWQTRLLVDGETGQVVPS